MINMLFREFLFVAYYKKENENEEAQKTTLILKQMPGSRLGDKKKDTTSNAESHKAAFSLLHEMLNKDVESMRKFVTTKGYLETLIKNIKKPSAKAEKT